MIAMNILLIYITISLLSTIFLSVYTKEFKFYYLVFGYLVIAEELQDSSEAKKEKLLEQIYSFNDSSKSSYKKKSMKELRVELNKLEISSKEKKFQAEFNRTKTEALDKLKKNTEKFEKEASL